MSKKVILIAAAVLMLGAGGGVTWKVSHKSGKASVKQKEKPKTEPMELDEFLVNLADSSESHYLKCTIVLEVIPDPKGGGGGGEGKGSPDTAKIRDAVITTMCKRQMSELVPEAGKIRLKEDIIKDVNRAMQRDAVTEVFFTSFAMQ